MQQQLTGRNVFWIFFFFFAFIASVNAFFITMALSTHTGVVTERPYEKGLAFNERLDEARNQPKIEHNVSYNNNILRWQLPMENADVTVNMMREVQSGYDFTLALYHVGGGIYEAMPTMPLPGAWTAHLKAQWNNQTHQTQIYQTTYHLIAR